jgi:ribose-phosphate pyrophosphokinase
MDTDGGWPKREAGALRVFVLHDSHAIGSRICGELGVGESAHEEREFSDGEHKARPLVDVRDCDVYVVQSLYGDPLHSASDKLCRLLFFIGALKDAAAMRVTAVIPYLAYARKDKRTQAGDPVTTRYVAALLEAVGTDAVMTVDVHNVAAFQNAFRCRTAHLDMHALFVRELAASAKAASAASAGLTVVAPDAGATHRAHAFRQALSQAVGTTVGAAFAEKYRSEGVLSGEMLVGDVKGKHVIIIDDLIASGATLTRTAESCRRLGATSVTAVATHGLFTGNASAVLGSGTIDRLLVSDTVSPFRLEHGRVRDSLVIVGAAPLLAGAIQTSHGGLLTTARSWPG